MHMLTAVLCPCNIITSLKEFSAKLWLLKNRGPELRFSESVPCHNNA